MPWYHTLHLGRMELLRTHNLATAGPASLPLWLRKLPECPSSGDGRDCDIALKAGGSIPQQEGGGERGRQAWVRLWGHCWK